MLRLFCKRLAAFFFCAAAVCLSPRVSAGQAAPAAAQPPITDYIAKGLGRSDTVDERLRNDHRSKSYFTNPFSIFPQIFR